MSLPLPGETRISAETVDERGAPAADAAEAARIAALTASHLTLLASRDGGWCRLYRDPGDGRLWELSYPRSEAHGGGPPVLRVLHPHEARARFGAFELP